LCDKRPAELERPANRLFRPQPNRIKAGTRTYSVAIAEITITILIEYIANVLTCQCAGGPAGGTFGASVGYGVWQLHFVSGLQGA